MSNKLNFSNRSSKLARLGRLLPSFLRRQRRRHEHLATRVFQARGRLKEIFSLKQKILLSGIAILIGAGIGFIQFSGFFEVTKISVKRSSLDLPLAEIESATRAEAIGVNIFQVDVNSLMQKIQITQPDISRVVIRKNYPREISVEVFKYPTIAELRIDTVKIYLNENGYQVSGEIPDHDLLAITLGEKLDLTDPQKQVIAPEHLINIRDAVLYFSALTELDILSTKYFPTAREAHLKTEKNFDIWLDLTLDFRSQLDKLVLAREELDLVESKYEYIDLRIRNKIFYKPK